MTHNQKGFTVLEVLLIVLVLLLAGFLAWNFYVANTKQAAKSGSEVSQNTNTTDEDTSDTLPWQRIASGEKAFSVQLPDGWGEVLRPKGENSLVIMGQNQPVYTEGQKVAVRDLEGFGTDAPIVFMVMVHDNIAEPRGAASDFTIGDLKGKKYSYVAQETLEGLGGEDAGDRRYDFRFQLENGKQLAVWYNVYINVDNQDQIETVEKIVKSIELQ